MIQRVKKIFSIRIFGLEKQDKHALVIWTIVLCISGIIVILIFNLIFISRKKYLTIANFRNQEVNVEVFGNIYYIDRFDIFNLEFRDTENFKIIVYSLEGKIIEEIEINALGYGANIVSVVTSRSNDFCFFKANVTGLYYYSDNLDINTIKKTELIKDKPAKGAVMEMSTKRAIYVFPGEASSKDLPATTFSREVVGFYPIKCEHLGDENQYLSTAKFFETYSGKQQRSFLNRSIEKIQKFQSSKDLENFEI